MASILRYVQAARGAGDTYFLFTAPAVQAVAGNYLFVLIDDRKSGGDLDADPPVWNGETIPEIFTPVVAFQPGSGVSDEMKRVQFFGKTLESSATADVTCDVRAYKAGNILAIVCQDVNAATAVGALFQQQVWDPFSNPSLGVTGVAAGDVVLSVLASTNYSSGGYGDGSATIWTPNLGQTAISAISSDEPRTGQLLSSSKTGTGTVTVGYTPVGGNNYAHFAFILKNAGPVGTINTLTTGGSPGLVVGQPFAMTTTDLATITAVTVTTVATPTATTSAINLALPSGDGTGDMKGWVDGEYYAFPGSVSVAATDSTLTGTGTYTLSIPATHLDVVFDTVETTDNTYIGNKLLAIGHPLANDDRGYYPSGNGLSIGENSGVSCFGAMTFVLWIQKVSGIMERYDVVINDAGEITEVRGISSRGISSRGISSRHISSRGIS